VLQAEIIQTAQTLTLLSSRPDQVRVVTVDIVSVVVYFLQMSRGFRILGCVLGLSSIGPTVDIILPLLQLPREGGGGGFEYKAVSWV